MGREPMPDVVVLLPGITGSVLHRNGRMAWGWSGRSALQALLDGGAAITRELALAGDDPQVDDLGDGVVATKVIPDLHLLPGVWKIDGYTLVADTLRRAFDLRAGENFFEFAYDWRRDNRVAARRLARQSHDWLTRWRETSGNRDARLILVAHSMGGLVSRYFLEVLDGWRDARALVTFGTPYRGSLNALGTLANGERKGPMGRIDLSALSRSFTAIYQLLPVYECYDAGDGALRRVGEVTGIPNVDAARAADALAFHREIEAAVASHRDDPAYARGRYAIFPVVGTQQPTFQSARRAGGGVELLRAHRGQDLAGDGTVPRPSATPLELSAERREMYAATRHGSLQNAEAVLAHVHGAISGLYFDLGTFRKPAPPRARVGLDLDDAYGAGEPALVSVQLDGAADDGSGAAPAARALALVVCDVESDAEVQRVAVAGLAPGEARAVELPPLAAGAYRLRVVGGDAVEPAEDTFVVLPASAA